MKANGIGCISNQPALHDKSEAAGVSDESRDEMLQEMHVTPKMNLLSSVISQNKIAREFVRMDGADELAPHKASPGDEQNQRILYQHPKKSSSSENLKSIVYDDIKWNFFVQSVCLKAPHSESAKMMREGLIDAFENGNWSQVKKDPLLRELTLQQTPSARNADIPDGTDKRIDLWLEASDFLKQLFTAVQDGDLLSHPNLVTDSRLIDFVLTLPEDTD